MNSQTLIFTKSPQTGRRKIGEYWNKKSSAPKSAKSKTAKLCGPLRRLCAGLPTPHSPDRRSPIPRRSLLAARPSAICKRRIERDATRLEVELFHELARFPCTMLAVHADVFPLDRQRAFVLHLVQRPDDLFEVHAAA